jgi:ubiquinone/menaquinone biosynthesis C-methylase UbiE
MGLFKKFVNQTRKPEGTLGKMMLRSMNTGHTSLANWGFAHLPLLEPEQIVDLGCGSGKNAAELLKAYPAAHVTAVDYSPLSVETAAEVNREAVAAGRCTVRQGDVSALALPEETFDLATAFETVYFWPGLEKCFAQVSRILRPGGYFLICNESDGFDDTGRKFEKVIDGMKVYTAQEIETTLHNAGFSEAKTVHHSTKPWICVLARK